MVYPGSQRTTGAGIDSVRSGIQSVARSPCTTDLLDFAYYSTSPDKISIRALVMVNFSFK
jgi:hypothetical protein